MPVDTLGDDVQGIVRGATDFLHSSPDDSKLRQYHLRNLEGMERRLEADIQERSTKYLSELQASERAEIDDRFGQLNSNPRFLRANAEQRADQQKFDGLRQINGGGFPWNISPVFYVCPLIAIGIAEWYVNFETFAAIFIPVFAIAGTILVATVFAWASHMHGTYIAQLSEILHPSVEYRNVLGRKIMLVIATILVVAALFTVVWLRYIVISDQLGIGSNSVVGTFGQPSSSMIWSRLGPTIAVNIFIWGVGTFYSWGMSEKVPELREAYRSLLRVNRKLERVRRPYEAEQQRIRATYNREREKNQVAVKEYSSLLNNVRAISERLRE